MPVAVLLNKHQQKTEATRRKFLASARRVFAKTGFEAARIEDIAADAGHTRGAFYANFESKESLFLALLEQQISEHVGRFTERLQACKSDAQKRAELRKYYVERASDREWSMLMLEFKLFAVRHPKLRAKLARAHREIRASAKPQLSALLDSEFQSDSEGTRVALEAVLSGLVLQHAYDPTALSERQLIVTLGHIFDVLLPWSRN
ncbi:MAG TPA: TetR/AcrR family transcriptional regulator [Bryobacteraceae bacterium]|jgi:AcrR family transcriptional regulator|nr:TetR/AcrR family transcriptional regulator [Bryobacteraceae bacterium]